jgi:hypothetical protein
VESWPIITEYFINAFHDYLCLYIHTVTVARKRPGKIVTTAMNTHAAKEDFWAPLFYMGNIVLKKIKLLVLPRTSYSIIVILFTFMFFVYSLLVSPKRVFMKTNKLSFKLNSIYIYIYIRYLIKPLNCSEYLVLYLHIIN